MIDTDKYEGHTTDWEWKDIGVSLAICSNGEAICFDTPDGKLAQDAPLLLAEVKRLREIEREWKQMWSKLEDYPDICAELICFMESEEE